MQADQVWSKDKQTTETEPGAEAPAKDGEAITRGGAARADQGPPPSGVPAAAAPAAEGFLEGPAAGPAGPLGDFPELTPGRGRPGTPSAGFELEEAVEVISVPPPPAELPSPLLVRADLAGTKAESAPALALPVAAVGLAALHRPPGPARASRPRSEAVAPPARGAGKGRPRLARRAEE
jgi:hypothetical protein